MSYVDGRRQESGLLGADGTLCTGIDAEEKACLNRKRST